ARTDTRADRHDTRERGREADADAVVGPAGPDRFGVEHDIAGDQYAEHDEDAKIAPVPAGGDLPRGQYRERGQECNVDHGGELSAPDRRARYRDAACEP